LTAWLLNVRAIVAPAGTPPDIIARIAREIANAVKDPQLASKLAG
jgi:tripartite-type tricarboxylate transporter receptor subunit TctC